MERKIKEKISGIIGLCMLSAFIIILCYSATEPISIKEFAINMAKSIGTIALGVGGVWLIIRN
jgi:hypothetical protein